MTEYLTAYMKSAEERLGKCSTLAEWQKLFDEHKDKIAFMQHERIVHFLVTMMFALILTILICMILLVSCLSGTRTISSLFLADTFQLILLIGSPGR